MLDGSIFRRYRSVLHATRESTKDIEEFQAQALLPERSGTPFLPQCDTQNPSVPDSNISMNSLAGSYRTRAGRLIRGNSKYTGEDWVK